MSDRTSLSTGGAGPVPALDTTSGSITGREQYAIESPAILRELHSQGVIFQCIEGIGHKFFIRPISFQGTLESRSFGAREVEGENGSESVSFTTFTLTNAGGKKETFEAFGEIAIPADSEITVNGARLVFDSLVIDFIGAASEETWRTRLKGLKELLTQSQPAAAFEIRAGARSIYQEEELKGLVEGMCSGESLSGRDWWSELLTELEGR